MNIRHELIKYEKKDNIGIIKLNRPSARNALNTELFLELQDTFNRIKEDKDLKVVILTGYRDEKQDYFSSGIDLKELEAAKNRKDDREGMENWIIKLQDAINSIEQFDGIVIAQVSGYCFGSAIEIALACDFIISSSETKFGMFETKYGVIPDLGGTFRLIRKVGYAYAKRIILFADQFSSSVAESFGLVDWIVPIEEIDGFVKMKIEKLLQNNWKAVKIAKNLINDIYPINSTAALEQERHAQMRIL